MPLFEFSAIYKNYFLTDFVVLPVPVVVCLFVSVIATLQFLVPSNSNMPALSNTLFGENCFTTSMTSKRTVFFLVAAAGLCILVLSICLFLCV